MGDAADRRPHDEREHPMEYVVLLYAPSELEAGPGAEVWDSTFPYHQAFSERLAERGIEVSGGALHLQTAATSLRKRDGQRLVTDGPFAETKEQLWGYYRVEAPDLDTVIDLCDGLWEAEHGTVEIRPLIPLGAPA